MVKNWHCELCLGGGYDIAPGPIVQRSKRNEMNRKIKRRTCGQLITEFSWKPKVIANKTTFFFISCTNRLFFHYFLIHSHFVSETLCGLNGKTLSIFIRFPFQWFVFFPLCFLLRVDSVRSIVHSVMANRKHNALICNTMHTAWVFFFTFQK